MVPKFLRKTNQPIPVLKKERPKGWNPATFYIIMFMLIGSNAIQMIALRNDFTNFSRKADSKIALLKETIERVQKGEDVDIEAALGTGDPVMEKEWEDGTCRAAAYVLGSNLQTRRALLIMFSH